MKYLLMIFLLLISACGVDEAKQELIDEQNRSKEELIQAINALQEQIVNLNTENELLLYEFREDILDELTMTHDDLSLEIETLEQNNNEILSIIGEEKEFCSIHEDLTFDGVLNAIVFVCTSQNGDLIYTCLKKRNTLVCNY